MGYKYLKFTSAGAQKKYNEDAVEILETGDGLLAVLCDGVGGDYGGDLAAKIALKSALYFFTTSEVQDNLRSKRLNQITKDHSLVQKLLDEGYITHKQAETHPQKNVIVKALGDNSTVEPDISKIKVNDFEKNKFFICSDGVSNLITQKELEEILNRTDHEEMKTELVKIVKLRGAVDDYSFIIIEKV